MTPTIQQIGQQLQRLKDTGFDKLIADAVTQYNTVPVTFVYAVASRETNCVNKLGDYHNGEAHGVGILQIDIQWPQAKAARDDGLWQTNPAPLLQLGCKLISENIAWSKRMEPNIDTTTRFKLVASAYNCGPSGALAGFRNGDSDEHTTGGDYGADVVARMAMFNELMNEDETVWP